jgi:hypothetical protein
VHHAFSRRKTASRFSFTVMMITKDYFATAIDCFHRGAGVQVCGENRLFILVIEITTDYFLLSLFISLEILPYFFILLIPEDTAITLHYCRY